MIGFALATIAGSYHKPREVAIDDVAALEATMQRQIDATDAEIDRLVYDLYPSADGTAEEIGLVEGASA